MTKFVVMGTNRWGGRRATLHDTVEDAKNAVRQHVGGPDNEPAASIEDLTRMERDLRAVTGTRVEAVAGHSFRDEVLFIAPIAHAPP